MHIIRYKLVLVCLVFFSPLMASRALAQNLNTTSTATSTITPTLSSQSEALEHNTALCLKADSDHQAICRNVMKKLSISGLKYEKVKVYEEDSWFSTAIDAKTPNTVHIIHGKELTLAGTIVVQADNVAIIGSGKPKLKLSRWLPQGVHTVLYSTGNRVHIEGLQIDPKGDISHLLAKVTNHFIQIKGGSTSIKNVSLLSAETAAKAIILAEAGAGFSTPSLDITNLDIKGKYDNVNSYALKTSGIQTINLQKIRTEHFTSGCALFSFENASSINLNSISSYINNRIAPSASGVLAIYTQPSSDVQLALKDVQLYFKIPTSQSPVIVAAKHDINGHLSLAGNNSFDDSSIRYPAGIIVSAGSETTPSTSTATITTVPPSAPEYWWSDLPVCASNIYQQHSNSTSTTVGTTVGTTEWYETATPHLTSTPGIPVTTIKTTEGTSVTPTTREAASKSISSVLTPEAAIWLSSSAINPSLVVKSSAVYSSSTNSTSAYPATTSDTPDIDESSTEAESTSTIKPSFAVSSSASTPSITTPPPAAENRDSEESISDSLIYVATIGAASAFYGLAVTGSAGMCFVLRKKQACRWMNGLLCGLPKRCFRCYNSFMENLDSPVSLELKRTDQVDLINPLFEQAAP